MNKGFTLIEIILYIGIAGIIIISVSVLWSIYMQSRVKNQTMAEVEQQALHLMQIITQTARNAESITTPTVGNSAASLTLDVVDVSSDPTVFDLSAGVIRITEATGSAIALTNSLVTASNLSFQNLSRSATPGTTRISFTLTYINPQGRNEYDFSKTFYATASLR